MLQTQEAEVLAKKEELGNFRGEKVGIMLEKILEEAFLQIIQMKDKIIMPFLYSKMIKGGTLGGGSFSSQKSRIMDSSKETRQKIPTL
ncbi:hypothetical protein DAPPUDRAFT_329658 [Daphnia pulex]|uniref:Uncharacterized protein n=1 Tax=Daphnia pulex TaxID=6669 RepID=E9HH98_DAPPU|nr:hypothetical protein DAPPUDRAFT_331129 [Daphnia pulex]EFX68882.1 hypothetical protein DAPPUDRAFT_329658 [Daphnia pulex]|eukprot:EFX67366.1 hypothetical protein DAPPUDRAFT_331129 [Daphnia pulex]